MPDPFDASLHGSFVHGIVQSKACANFSAMQQSWTVCERFARAIGACKLIRAGPEKQLAQGFFSCPAYTGANVLRSTMLISGDCEGLSMWIVMASARRTETRLFDAPL